MKVEVPSVTISESIRSRLEAGGVAVLQFSDFANLEEYVSTIRAAKVFVTSYGGAACTNRFFCSPDARVILIANNAYRAEYRFPEDPGSRALIGVARSFGSDCGAFPHIRAAHLFPVAEQIVLLDQSDTMTDAEADRILRLCDGAGG